MTEAEIKDKLTEIYGDVVEVVTVARRKSQPNLSVEHYIWGEQDE
jgi:hypothetical protein